MSLTCEIKKQSDFQMTQPPSHATWAPKTRTPASRAKYVLHGAWHEALVPTTRDASSNAASDTWDVT